MTKALFVIFTCNRFYYLKNCVQSIFEFVNLDDCQVMILDMNTVENNADQFYKEISGQVIIKQFSDRIPNELYRAMNYAIQYCIDNNIPYINLIQDDYQYLYKQNDMVDKVVKLFENNKRIGQIQTNMVWKRKKIDSITVFEFDGINYAKLNDKILVDTGFTRVSIYKKTGLYPSSVISYDQNSSKTFGFGKNRYKKLVNGELWFGKRSRKLGYQRVISLKPNMAMMFDCAYVRMWERFGRYFPPPNKYYLKPLSHEEMKNITRRGKHKKFSYIEDFAKPDGWTPTTYEKHNMEKIKVSII